jgi:V/A-type H+-transporting ATPase subunit G/H
MRKGEALLKVKEAETEVQEMKKRATDETERISKEAKKEVLRIQEESRRKADETLRGRLEAGRKEVEVKTGSILEQGKQEAAAIKQKGETKIDPAVSLLLKRFEEGVVAVPSKTDE